MDMTNRIDIIAKAVGVLKKKHPDQEINFEYLQEQPTLNILGLDFVCMAIPDLSVADLLELQPAQPRCNEERPVLYITINATPKVMDFAVKNSVNVLDCAGNYNIQSRPKEGFPYFMWVNRGERPIANKERSAYPIFKEAGLKVIFYLLCNRQNIDRPYREIQQATGVAIGTVKNIIDGMIDQHFVKVDGRKRYLINIDRLLNLWAVNFGQTLKPKLLLARMDFRESFRKEWQHIALPQGMYWGGEAAAAIDGLILNPEEFTIYSEIPAAALMKTGAVTPDNNGKISVYKIFWSPAPDPTTVPSLLIYADLMYSDNSRCVETALRMKKHELEYLFK